MPIQPLFLNTWQKGSEQNANLGAGTMLGVENYTVKGVARLTKDTTKVSGTVVTDTPLYFTSESESVIFAQGDSGKVYKSTDTGNSWTDISDSSITPTTDTGTGIIFYQGYLFAWVQGGIYYCSSPYGSGDWSMVWKTGINGTQNTPFLFPNDGSIYFGNANKVGKIGFGTASTFNPGGSSGIDYFYDDSRLTLPDCYQVNCISFLPTNFLALGTGYNPSATTSIGNGAQIADVILWNPTLSTYETPLRLFSQAATNSSGVNQIINRNNVLYAVTGGNHAIFSTQGNSYALIDDLSLQTTSRVLTGTGEQATNPIFINQYPSAIAVFGNKLYTGVSTSVNSAPSGYGNFPLGVWSEAFLDEGTAVQCEFPISTGTVIANSNFRIGALYPVNQAQMLIGWQDGGTYGIDKTNFTDFQTDASVVQIESQMMEIGTPLEPNVITTIQANLVRSLLPGQQVKFYYRSAFDQAYTPIPNGTFNSTTGNIGQNNSLKCTLTDIGTIKFVQLLVELSTGSPNEAWTPEIRTIIVK